MCESKIAINLEVPLLKQRTKQDCSLTCGLMLLRYYGRNVAYDEFSVKTDPLGRANIFDLAISLKKNGLKPSIFFFNYSLFDDDSFLSQIKNLANEGIVQAIYDCVLKGISVSHKIFVVQDIERMLMAKKPLIILVSVREFRKKKLNKWRGHFIVITGFDDKYFYYNDPHWDDKKFGKHKMEKELLMAAIYRTNFPAILWVENES